MERRGKGGREEREEKGKEGGKGPSPPPRKKILAPPLHHLLSLCICHYLQYNFYRAETTTNGNLHENITTVNFFPSTILSRLGTLKVRRAHKTDQHNNSTSWLQ